MKKKFSILVCFLMISNALKADESKPKTPSFEKLLAAEDLVYVISSFEEINYLTAFSLLGEMTWEVIFASAIVSCDLEGEYLFVFSKARNGSAYYLTCIEANTGKLIWEKPIWAPKN